LPPADHARRAHLEPSRRLTARNATRDRRDHRGRESCMLASFHQHAARIRHRRFGNPFPIHSVQ
jgi:hypothetical protein